MSRVLVTGSGGQVGSELARADWPAAAAVTLMDRSALDITDAAAVKNQIADAKPDVIVNAAAYTAVDRAEEDSERAMAVNRSGVEHLAVAANAASATLIHISTDYVFDGTKQGWYTEADPPNPTGVYGETKLAGEAAALGADRGIVLRTSWVYGALRPNFVLTMRRLAAERDELGVVADQIGCPTAAAEISTAIVKIVEAGNHTNGLFHLAAPDDASWWDVATEAISQMRPASSPTINKLSTAEYPTPAVRPANSRLDSTRLEEIYGIVLPSWRQSLQSVSAELNT